jgi:hypothetical protein
VEALWDLVSGRELKITTQSVTDQVYGVVLQVEEQGSLVNINNHLVELQFAIQDQGNVREFIHFIGIHWYQIQFLEH